MTAAAWAAAVAVLVGGGLFAEDARPREGGGSRGLVVGGCFARYKQVQGISANAFPVNFIPVPLACLQNCRIVLPRSEMLTQLASTARLLLSRLSVSLQASRVLSLIRPLDRLARLGFSPAPPTRSLVRFPRPIPTLSAIMPSKTVTLPTGHTLAVNGFGTWKSEPGKVGAAVKKALEIGYRHIDCAAIYMNEAEVGAVFAEMFGGDNPAVKREDVWITSKVWTSCGSKKEVVAACRQSLSDLKLDYLDEYLVHWPANWEHQGLPITETTMGTGPDGKLRWSKTNTLQSKWEGMEECHRLGLTKVRLVSTQWSGWETCLVYKPQRGAEGGARAAVKSVVFVRMVILTPSRVSCAILQHPFHACLWSCCTPSVLAIFLL